MEGFKAGYDFQYCHVIPPQAALNHLNIAVNGKLHGSPYNVNILAEINSIT